jgi:hypothetical protein
VAAERGGGSLEGLSTVEGIGGRGNDVGEPEHGSPAGSKWMGREYSLAQCLGWDLGGRRGVRAGCPWWLSDGEHGGVQRGAGVVKRWRRKNVACSTVGCSLYSR